MNSICRLSRNASNVFLFKGCNLENRYPCLHNTTRNASRLPLHQMKRKLKPTDDIDFIEWQKQLREDAHRKSSGKGLEKFDLSAYNEQYKMVVKDEDLETDKERKVTALKSAIELYKERQPRLKQDHPQFIQWCILRMFEYDITEEVELYELLFECYPPHMYHVAGWIERVFPKHSPGYMSAVDLVTVGQQRKVKPTYTLYRNVVRSFGEKHPIASMVRRWAWFHYVFRNANPYPLKDGTYNFADLATRHMAMAEYVAERTMDQNCLFETVENDLGEYLGTSVMSQTQQDLAILQVPDDTMRLTGPHSIWVGRVQRWYWVLRREERGDEFEGAPLGMVVSPYKEMSREGAQTWLDQCRQKYKGIAGSNILFENPSELLYIDPEAHFKERVALFSDGIEDVYIESSILPDVVDEKKKQSIKKLSGSKDRIKFMRDKDAAKDDDEW